MNSKQQQELEENLVFLRDQFRDLDSQIKLPHSLDAEMLRYKLEHLDLLEEKPRKKYAWLRPAAGVAACFVLVFGSIYAMRGKTPELSAAPVMDAPMSSVAAAPEASPASEEGLSVAETAVDVQDAPVYASNYTEVRDAAAKMNADNAVSGAAPRAGGALEDEAAPNAVNADAADAGLPEAAPAVEAPLAAVPKATAFYAPSSGNFSAENPAEYGAGAQDTLKEEDGYLYSFVRSDASSSNDAIYVVSPENTTYTAKIDLPGLELREFYLYNDRLVTVGSRYGTMESVPQKTIVEATDSSLVDTASENDSRMQETSLTTAIVYDISDPANPKSIQTFTQDGGYLASRMSETGALSMVSSKYVDVSILSDQDALLKELVPAVSNGAETKLLEPDQLAISQMETASASFSVATVLDPSTGSVSTQAVLGGSTDGAYLTDSSIYLYGSEYKPESQMEFTRVIRFASDKLRLAGETELTGRAGGRSSFSEANGKLRVVLTTASDSMNINCTSSVSVLGADLSLIASLQGIVPNVALSSVRFLDDVVYLGLLQDNGGVVAVDLSDSTSPRLAGEQTLSALPDFLRSAGNGLLIGIGGTGDGIKLSLLDASDPLNLRELHSVSFSGGSEALYNGRSVLVDAVQKLVAFQADGTEEGSGYRVYSFDKEAGFVLKANLTPQEDAFFSRGLTIGNKLYLSSARQIEAYQTDNFTKLKTFSL